MFVTYSTETCHAEVNLLESGALNILSIALKDQCVLFLIGFPGFFGLFVAIAGFIQK